MGQFQHHLLIATPAMDDPFFRESVIYLCEHNSDGAMGLMLNRITDTSIAELVSKMNFMMADKREIADNAMVLLGGPVSLEKGFVLHSKCIPPFQRSDAIGHDIWLTSSMDVLETLGKANAPEHYLVAIGCCSWAAGQLEAEIRQNMWLVAPFEQRILFDTPYQERWQSAVELLGIAPEDLAYQGGIA
ncbi:YqgE/AlgH family protein [Spirabiliibacterium falconis]|uniref:YqgE/AlgH family protein n=1 Tax=Spirabiliibacterium falconis TaxID=572023 RepID=UPI001AACB6D1|nr:YqgE/AlgH family protein [Spirabiliibacterium falconis]MBE2894411.1 YqgE/AlgH family protein [Spirabiliibacterium falconis]